MSALRAALDDYLRIRRRLGFAMPQDGRYVKINITGSVGAGGCDSRRPPDR
jgi:hypothetical protein